MAPGPDSRSPKRGNSAESPIETPSLPQGAVVDYDQHYRTHDVSPAQLLYDVRFLRQLNRMGEVEQAIAAYLKYHGNRAESWMYSLLAVTYEVNNRSSVSVKTALGWAGFLARKQADPFTLIQVADMLILRDLSEIPLPNKQAPIRTGELLDLAFEKAPYRYEPILLSMLLAEKTTDPIRMGKAAENLFSLGWPGYDEFWRSETRKRVEAMATKLQSEGKTEAANTLREKMQESEPRDLFLRLSWKGNAGLELNVSEPLGATATVAEPRTVFGGAIVKAGRGKHAESEYVCPFAFDGTYEVRVDVLYNDEKDPAREVVLDVFTHEGSENEEHQTLNVELKSSSPIKLSLQGGRRTKVLPFSPPSRIRLDIEELEASTNAASASKPTPNMSRPADPSDSLRVPSPDEPKKRSTIDPEPSRAVPTKNR